MEIRAITPEDKVLVSGFLTEHWGSPQIIVRGHVHQADELPGFIVYSGESIVGLITYKIDEADCEIVSLNSLEEQKGIGTALIEAVKKLAKDNGCKRLVLITTNDNMQALGYYQRRGFILTKIYPNALELSRKIKPQIPIIGLNNIPLRDEIELELNISY